MREIAFVMCDLNTDYIRWCTVILDEDLALDLAIANQLDSDSGS